MYFYVSEKFSKPLKNQKTSELPGSELYKNVFKKDVKLTFNIGLQLKKD